MRIHTNTLTAQDIHNATLNLPGVHATFTKHGSRTHKRAFEISLTGNGYHKNSGTYGASDEYGATWDEWGVFIATLFDVDPDALAGRAKNPTYEHVLDFHEKTHYRFESLELPEDTHKRHKWVYWGLPGHFTCSTCSAEKSH